MQNLKGIHHVTAITGNAQQITDFYCGVMGLHLVKKTVNFDDPYSYHLYFGDAEGSPGSLITFFVWPGAVKGSAGVGETASVAYEVPKGSAAYWKQKLSATEANRHGATHLVAQDPDGMQIEIVEAQSGEGTAVNRIQGVTLNLRNPQATAALLTGQMQFLEAGEGRFAVGEGWLDLASDGARRGRMGAGSIHHIAFRAADDPTQLEWLQHIDRLGLQVSPVMDRKYFHSIYFREPGGVLFEIATDPPGMSVDEPAGHLGESLMLPVQYERDRKHLEETLPPIHISGLEARA